jgi:hypothetical protein
MRPDSLSRQYKDPANQSGGILQLSYTRDMTSRTEYIARDALDDVRRQARQLQALQGMDR